MSNAITMGIFWHLIGAASAACFYAPFKKVKKWSWETMCQSVGLFRGLSCRGPSAPCYYRISGRITARFSLSTLLPVFLVRRYVGDR